MKKIFLFLIALLFSTTTFAQGEYKYIDGWKVTYLGQDAPGGTNTRFVYNAAPLTAAQCSAAGLTNCTGPLKRITLEVPVQYPAIKVLDTSVNQVSRGNPGLARDADSGIVGIPFTFNSEQTNQEISYTIEGVYSKSDINVPGQGIWVGLVDSDTCADCGESGNLPGPKVKYGVCDTTVLPGNVVFSFDQHRCTSADGLQALKNVVTNYVIASDAYLEKPKVSAQSYMYGAINGCDTRGMRNSSISGDFYNDIRPFSRILGDFSNYAGILRWDYGTNTPPRTNTYYAINDVMAFSCEKAPLSEGIELGYKHASSSWGTSQKTKYAVMITNGMPDTWKSGTTTAGTCANPCNCYEAKVAAEQQSAAAKAAGVIVVGMYYNDLPCGCSQADRDLAKQWTKDMIASPGWFFESRNVYTNGVHEFQTAMDTFRAQMQKTLICDNAAYSCGAQCNPNSHTCEAKPCAPTCSAQVATDAYKNLACSASTISVGINGRNSQPNITGYNWTTTCKNGVLSNPLVVNPTLSFTAYQTPATVSPDCKVTLTVTNAGGSATCEAPVSVGTCNKDCAGTINGTKVNDACGVCGGDGSSCLPPPTCKAEVTTNQYLNQSCGASTVSVNLNASGSTAGATYEWGTNCTSGVIDNIFGLTPKLSWTAYQSPAKVSPNCSVFLKVTKNGKTASCNAPVSLSPCKMDCAGVINGTAVLDKCGVCNGDGKSCEPKPNAPTCSAAPSLSLYTALSCSVAKQTIQLDGTKSTDGSTFNWTSNCQASSVKTTTTGKAELTFDSFSSSGVPANCSVNLTVTKSGLSTSCAAPIQVGPCQTGCTDTDVVAIKATLDNQGNQTLRAINGIARLGLIIGKKTNNKTLLAQSRAAIKEASARYKKDLWNDVWINIPNVTRACSAACTSKSLVSNKSVITTSFDKQVSLASTIARAVTRATKDKKIKAQITGYSKRVVTAANSGKAAVQAIPSETC